MKQRPRRYFTDSEMAVIWDRWEKGDSINEIARDLGRYHSAMPVTWTTITIMSLMTTTTRWAAFMTHGQITARAGITAGCGGSNYCPSAPVTRTDGCVPCEDVWTLTGRLRSQPIPAIPCCVTDPDYVNNRI